MPETFNSLLRQIVLYSPEKKAEWDRRLKSTNPEGHQKLVEYLARNKGAVDEALGGEHWMKKLGASTFTRPFAPIQKRFIQWNWDAIQNVQDRNPLQPRDGVGFLPWPRETGKSSIVEWACIAEGCLLKSGYVIYLSSKLSQAVDHVVAVRDRIESEHVADLYPWMGKPKLGTHGNKFGWGQEFLMTGGGWAIRPVGADVAMRGGKSINIRPSLVVIDDYDELGDSPHVVEHKEHMLTRAILPMGNENTRVLVPQNPIHENSVVNRMLTGASLALAIRTVFGEINEDGSLSSRPIPAVNGLVYEVRQSDEGPYCEITQGESNWPGISVDGWGRTLNRVGPSAFLSEYQHSLQESLEERVLPEYDDRVLMLHVASWDMFEKIYGMRRIPSDWPGSVGLDIGYTGKHLSSWTFMTKVPEGYPLAGSVFRYRGRNFTNTSIDDQSIAVRGEMWPDENVEQQWMSHEKLGERMLLAQKHGWNFHPCDSSKESGWQAWRHYLRADRTKAHPFHTDNRDENTGMWKLGRPAFFDLVVHSQLRNPIDDYGMKEHRTSAYTQRRRPVKLTESGFTVDQPVKMGDDPNDSSRMLFASASFGPSSRGMTQAQRLQSVIPAGYHKPELAMRADLTANDAHLIGEMAEYFAKKAIASRNPVARDLWGQPLR